MHKQSCKPAGMSSSLVMTTLLVGMSWPWVAALAMGEADMSGKHGGEMAFLRERTAALRTAPPSHHLPLLRCHCVWTVANPRVFISAHFSTPQAEEECGGADLWGETGKELIGGHVVVNDSCHFELRHMHLINGLHHLESDLHGYFLDSWK